MTNYTDIIGNREIKFRAWNYEEEWMSEPFNIFDLNRSVEKYQVGDSYSAYSIYHRSIMEDYIGLNKSDDVLMQYTGLKDKNGKDIFEGDIVQYLCQKETTQVLQTYVVVFDYDAFCKLMDGEHYAFGFSQNGQLLKEKVIGNVFENPELLPQ